MQYGVPLGRPHFHTYLHTFLFLSFADIYIDMNILDLIILCFLLILMIQSYRVGFLDELLSLVIFIAGGYLAYYLSSYLIPYLDFLSNNYLILKIVSIIILFIIFYIIGKLVKTFILDMIDETELNGFDKFMGMILGLLKGVVVVSVIIMIFSYFEINAIQNLIQTSFISNKILYAISRYRELVV